MERRRVWEDWAWRTVVGSIESLIMAPTERLANLIGKHLNLEWWTSGTAYILVQRYGDFTRNLARLRRRDLHDAIGPRGEELLPVGIEA